MTDEAKSYHKRGFTLFGSDGKLKQIEYAKKSVSDSLPVLGLQTKEGVVLVSHNTSNKSELLVSGSIDNIHKINKNFGLTVAGHMTDGKKLAEKLREKSAEEQLEYGSIDDTIVLIEDVSEHMQETINSNEFRPYGVSLLIAGIDASGEYKLYKIEPDGAISEWLATAIGNNQTKLNKYLEQNYSPDLSLQEATELIVKNLLQADNNIQTDELTIATLTKENGFRKKTRDEVSDVINQIKGDEL